MEMPNLKILKNFFFDNVWEQYNFFLNEFGMSSTMGIYLYSFLKYEVMPPHLSHRDLCYNE